MQLCLKFTPPGCWENVECFFSFHPSEQSGEVVGVVGKKNPSDLVYLLTSPCAVCVCVRVCIHKAGLGSACLFAFST